MLCSMIQQVTDFQESEASVYSMNSNASKFVISKNHFPALIKHLNANCS